MHNQVFINIFYYHILSHYKSLGLKRYLFDYIRREKFGETKQAYSGNGECGNTCRLLKESYLKDAKINVKVQSNFSREDHMFLTWNSFIIDPTYKQLLYINKGPVEKFHSPYMKYLFNLPPIFIGTSSEMYLLQKELKIIRSADFYHQNDEIYDNWYE